MPLWLPSAAVWGDDTTFAEIWRQEVIEGDIQAAAGRYEEFFLDFRGKDVASRKKAAFRAGLCFERLSNPSRARNAFKWALRLRKDGEAARTISSEVDLEELKTLEPLEIHALLRLERLRELDRRSGDGRSRDGRSRDGRSRDGGGGGEEGIVARPDATILQAVAGVLDRLRGRTRELESRLQELERSLIRRRRSVAILEDVHRRFERAGVTLTFAAMTTAVPPSDEVVLHVLDGLFPVDEDGRKTQIALAQGLLRDAVEAGLQDDRRQALLQVQKSLVVFQSEPARVLKGELLRTSSERQGAASSPLTLLSDRQIIDSTLLQTVETRTRIQSFLDAATDWVDRGRPDYAIGELARVSETLDWTPSTVRGALEVRELEATAQRRLVLLARGAVSEDTLATLWRKRRSTVTTLLAVTADTVDVALEEYRYRSPVRVSDRRLAEYQVVKELRGLLRRARSQRSEGRFDDSRALLEAVPRVASWIAEADPRSTARRAAATLLAELESGKSEGAESHD